MARGSRALKGRLSQHQQTISRVAASAASSQPTSQSETQGPLVPTLPPDVELPNEFSSSEPITLTAESLNELASNPPDDAPSELPESLPGGIPTAPTAPLLIATSAEAHPPGAEDDDLVGLFSDDGHNYEGIDWDRLPDL